MELLLNIFWVLLAGTAVAAFLVSTPARLKQFLLAFGALCCALLLLFPSISVSDDLHVQAVVTEDSNPSKKLVNAAHISAEHFTTILFVLGALLAVLFRMVGFVRIGTVAPYLSSLLDQPVLGRAPPLSAAA